ncbi:hypothetical protein ACFPZ0_12320 [Streptomonospora nanhaiensis]|uniref:Uncharacterized protein n=1 Tax=Streptomonospora nanhaiensis TaxID=1323731 RepID=A0A853BQQ4_9ACTN|nr:hypothetical protein [Streptomonospora nanhaiensis]MBV2366785.1 hypothetical protein [Streptomonospora nanhaiensis]MBX9387687.1 hypothetical protein [Streptomonospora nanhaiensis]NYI96887.1 hypothetical protein [Streptomonospora nanhaiensis]
MSGDQEDGLRSELVTGMRRALENASAEELARDPQGALRLASLAARLAYEMLRHDHLRTAADHVRKRWGEGAVRQGPVDAAEVGRRLGALRERLDRPHTPAEIAAAATGFAGALLPGDAEAARAHETAAAVLRFTTARSEARGRLEAAAAEAAALATLHPGSADLGWAHGFVQKVAATEAAHQAELWLFPAADPQVPADPAAREYEVRRLLARRSLREPKFRKDVRTALGDLVKAERGRDAGRAEEAAARLSALLHGAANAAPGVRPLRSRPLTPEALKHSGSASRPTRRFPLGPPRSRRQSPG